MCGSIPVVPFLTIFFGWKRYCGNEGLSLAWDRMEVRQMPLFTTAGSYSGLGESIPVLHQNRQTSKEIKVDISYF